MSTIKGLSLNEDGKLDVKLNGELFARNENGEIGLKLADGLIVGDNGLEISSEIGGSVTIDPYGGLVEDMYDGVKVAVGSGICIDGSKVAILLGSDSGLGIDFDSEENALGIVLAKKTSQNPGCESSGLTVKKDGDDEEGLSIKLSSDSGLHLADDGLKINYNEDQFGIIDRKLTLKNGGSVTIDPYGGIVDKGNGLTLATHPYSGFTSLENNAFGVKLSNYVNGDDDYGYTYHGIGNPLGINEYGLHLRLATGVNSSGRFIRDSGLTRGEFGGLRLDFNTSQFSLVDNKLTLKNGATGGGSIDIAPDGYLSEGNNGLKVNIGSGLINNNNDINVKLGSDGSCKGSGLKFNNQGLEVAIGSGLWIDDTDLHNVAVQLASDSGLGLTDGLKILYDEDQFEIFGNKLTLKNGAIGGGSSGGSIIINPNGGLVEGDNGLGIKLGSDSGLDLKDDGLNIYLSSGVDEFESDVDNDSGLTISRGGLCIKLAKKSAQNPDCESSGLTIYRDKGDGDGLSIKLSTDGGSGLRLAVDGLKLDYNEDQFKIDNNKLTLKDGVVGGSVTIDPNGGLVEGDNGLGLNVGAGLKIDGNGAIALAESIGTGEGTIVLGKHLKLDENGAVTVDIASLLGKYLKVDENGAATIDTAELLSDIASTN